jgi:hypothetical protein
MKMQQQCHHILMGGGWVDLSHILRQKSTHLSAHLAFCPEDQSPLTRNDTPLPRCDEKSQIAGMSDCD